MTLVCSPGLVWLSCYGLILILNYTRKGRKTSCKNIWPRHVRLQLYLATQAWNVHGGPFSDFPPNSFTLQIVCNINLHTHNVSLARLCHRQRSFSNADSSVVGGGGVNFKGGKGQSQKRFSNFLAPLCHLAAELFKCRLVRRHRRRRRRRQL